MPNKNTPNSELLKQYEREYKRILQAIRRQTKLGYIVPEELKPVSPSKVEKVSKKDVTKLIKLTPQAIRKKSTFVDKQTGEAFDGLDIVKSHHKAKPSSAKLKERKPRKQKQIQLPTESKRKRNRKGEAEQEKQTTQKRKPKQTEPEYAPPRENNLNMQIVESITQMLESWTPYLFWRDSYKLYKAQMRFAIMDKWNEAIRTEGAYQLAYRLENKAEYYHRLVDRVIHFSDSPWEDQINLSEIITFLTGTMLSAEEYDYYSSQAEGYIRDIIVGDSFG